MESKYKYLKEHRELGGLSSEEFNTAADNRSSLAEEFKLYENMWNSLTEAKADTQRLIDFAGEDLANRFITIKNKLKAPENDLYYWIKNKTVAELETAVAAAENTKSKRALAREAKVDGADIVCESEHWKVYHITTYEASQIIGRDTTWCITGIHGNDYYWNDYTRRGIDFYFLVTKGEYDPRGTDSKFALAIYPNDLLQVFNQQDEEMNLEDVPYIDEVNIPGIDLFELEAYEDNTYAFCYYCDCELNEEDAWMDPDGEVLCYDCWHDQFFSCYYCNETFALEAAPTADEVDCDYPVCRDCAEKHNLYYTSSYTVGVEGTDKTITHDGIPHKQALSEIEDFINKLTPEEKENIDLLWICDEYKPGDRELDVIIHIDGPKKWIEFNGEEDFEELYKNPVNRIADPCGDYCGEIPEDYLERIEAALQPDSRDSRKVPNKTKCSGCGTTINREYSMEDLIKTAIYCDDCWYDYLETVDHGMIHALILMVENNELFDSVNSKAVTKNYLDNWYKNRDKYLPMSDYASSKAEVREYDKEFIELAKEAGVY